jgi:hypothetical protein
VEPIVGERAAVDLSRENEDRAEDRENVEGQIRSPGPNPGPRSFESPVAAPRIAANTSS